MTTLPRVVLCAALVAALGNPLPVDAQKPDTVRINPYRGMQQREDVFEFAQKPAVNHDGGTWIITFATTAACDATVSIVDPDGKLKTRCALPGLTVSDGIRVGRSGALYIVQGLKPLAQKGLPDGLAPGSRFEDSRWGSLVKFNSRFGQFSLGRIIGTWENESPADATHAAHFWKAKFDNVHWTYGGAAPLSARYRSCTCLKMSFDLDDYERSFVPAAQTCTVNVIDASGNVMARLGGYGNLSDLAIEDRLAFNLPRSVAVTDTTMWVHDAGNLTIVRASLGYETEAAIVLK